MMQDTHRVQEERARPTYQRVLHPRDDTGVRRSKVEGFKIFSFCGRVSPPKLAIAERWPIELFPPNRGLGQSPKLIGSPGAARLKLS